MSIQHSPPGSQECLCPLPDVNNSLGSDRDLTVFSTFTLAAHTGHEDRVLALVNTALIKAMRGSGSSGGHSEDTGHSLRSPACGAPVAGPVLEVSKIAADVLRHVGEPSLLSHVLDQMLLALEFTSGAVSVLSSC